MKDDGSKNKVMTKVKKGCLRQRKNALKDLV